MLTQLPQDQGEKLVMHNDLLVGHDRGSSLKGQKHSAINGYSAKNQRDGQLNQKEHTNSLDARRTQQ